MTLTRPNLTLIAMLGLLGVLAFSGLSMAGPVQDIPEGLGDALGLDDPTNYVAKMILASAAILAVALALSVAKMPFMGLLITLLVVIGVFTAIGYLDVWVLILTGVTVGLWLAASMRGAFESGS